MCIRGEIIERREREKVVCIRGEIIERRERESSVH